MSNLCEYNNKEGLPTDLSQALQRKYSVKLQFRESSWINFYCLFNKNDINMRFFIPDAKDMQRAGFTFQYYKDIVTCPFIENNLILNTISNDKFQIVNQFHEIKDHETCKIVLNESIVLGKVKSGANSYEQSANIYVFLDSKMPSKSCYYIIFERQFIDPRIQKKVVKSIGLELKDSERLESNKG